MELDKTLKQVDVERLYRHVLKLEGPNHPIDYPEKLNQAADYIHSQLRQYRVAVRFQEFQVPGYPYTFRNVEGWLGNETEPAVVIINHYDNKYNDPGANDNLSGVAVMLEAARVLAGQEGLPHIRFLSATLEEGNPVYETRLRELAQELGLTDDQHRFNSYGIAKAVKAYQGRGLEAFIAGEGVAQAMDAAVDGRQGHLSESLLRYLRETRAATPGLAAATSTEQSMAIGSSVWVEQALEKGLEIKLAICTDEIGTVSTQEYSQVWPANLTEDLLRTYKVDYARRIGDFVLVITDQGAEQAGQTFCTHCEAIDLKHAWMPLPVSAEQVADAFPQVTGSDHAAFWRAGIPALFITDTSGLRSPYYGHSPANTIDKIDFDQVAKICRAVIATAIDPAL